MRGRPFLRTSYEADQAVFDTATKKSWAVVALAMLVVLPFRLDTEFTLLMTLTFVNVIGALGLNVVTGYAGQVSLGHAFFMGLGAYTAVVIGGTRTTSVVGFGVENILVWLPAAGIVAAIVGAAVAPIATRLRGLYLAVVTLGLVLIGLYVFEHATSVTGGVGVGRRAAAPKLFGFDFGSSGEILGVAVSREQRVYLLCFAVAIVAGIVVKNIVRSGVGRAFAAVRDRDVAAATIGVDLARTKLLAFVISSFFAGVAGALYITAIGYVTPTSFNLLLSVQFLAMILIGGQASIAGSVMGAAFVSLLPRMTEEFPRFLPFVTSEPVGGWMTVSQMRTIIYGLLIVVFLVFESGGLFGIWIRARTYWRGWPFTS